MISAATVAVLGLVAVIGGALDRDPDTDPKVRDHAMVVAVSVFITGSWWAIALAAGVGPDG